MTSIPQAPSFAVVSGQAVRTVLAGRERAVVDLIEAAYRLHGGGETTNPPSYFLRFPDQPANRIIALPASVGGDVNTAGIKWISSFPANVTNGLPRASAVLILNDLTTGYPYACLESSVISAVRTAASAALAAVRMAGKRQARGRVGFFGTGLIARYVHQYLAALDWPFEEISVFDASAERARAFGAYLEDASGLPVHQAADPEELIRGSDLVVFATTAAAPHVCEPSWFNHHPLVLNVSLRDLSPEVLLESVNILDDVEHCLKADTSPHLVEQRTGNRDFIDGTLYDVLTGALAVPEDRTVVFSPFGLGVLDLALGAFVHEESRKSGDLAVIDGFFSELDAGHVGRR